MSQSLTARAHSNAAGFQPGKFCELLEVGVNDRILGFGVSSFGQF
jgi:hypothetical protein